MKLIHILLDIVDLEDNVRKVLNVKKDIQKNHLFKYHITLLNLIIFKMH